MLENINLGIEFTGHNIDPVVPAPEYVTAQTGDFTFIIITTLVLLGIIGLFLIGISKAPLFSATTQGLHLRTSSKSKQNSKPTISAIFAVILALMLICSCYFSTKAFAGNNDANIDVTPDKIQVVVDGDTGTIQEAVFNFENNSDNFYLFDKTTSMSLTPEAAAITQAADWDLQLTALETDLFNGAPDGSDYTVPGDVVTLMPHTSAQAVLKFNKSDFETAKKLVGIQVFTLTMIPDQHVVDIPTAPDNIVYNGQSQTAIPDTEAYTVKDGSGTNADSYNAIVTLNSDYKWPDKSTTPQTISWAIAPLPVALSWDTPSLTYNGEAQHPTATVTNIKGSDSVTPETYSYPEGYDGFSAKEQKVNVATLGGTSASNYTLEGASGNEKTYTIAKKALTITADDKDKKIGRDEPVLTATFVGLVHDEEFVKDEDYNLTRETGDEYVGATFDITVTVLQVSTVAQNYSITTDKGTLTIIPNEPSITPDNTSKTYGEADPTSFTATVADTDAGHDLVLGTDFTLSRIAGENAGEYKISVTLIETSPSVIYYGKDKIICNEGTFTVVQLAVNLTWTSDSFTYNAEAQHPTASITNAISGDVVSVKAYAGLVESYNLINAGTQKCKVSELQGEDKDNYSLEGDTNKKEYSIDKADINMDLSINGESVTQPRNFQDVTLAHTLTVTFGPDPTHREISYQWYEAPSFEGQQTEISGATDAAYIIDKDLYIGQKFYFLKVTINTDDGNFKNTSKKTTNEKYVKFVYTAMTFNDQLSNATTTLYTKYATNELYTGETSTETAEIPTAAKPDFVFDGWFTGASDGSRVVDFEKQIVPETIDGYVKDGKWANTDAKTIYAHFYQAQYMTFTNQAEGENTISFNFAANSWSNLPSLILRVSTDAETWKLIQTDVPGTFEIATLSALNDKVYVAGYNPNGFSSDTRVGTFCSTGKFSVSGNYMGLIDYTRSDITAIPNDYCFQRLFKDCSNLTSVPKLDFTFDKESQSHCLNQMFENCSLINYLEVTFTQWPTNGFSDWVSGVAGSGTFICPKSLEWKCSGGDFCPREFHNEKGEARAAFTFNGVGEAVDMHLYTEDDEESHSSYSVVSIDYDESYGTSRWVLNGKPVDLSRIDDLSYTQNFLEWTENLRSMRKFFNQLSYKAYLGAGSKLQDLDLSNWDVSNVRCFNNCFEKTLLHNEFEPEFDGYINLSGWSFTKADSLDYMFNSTRARYIITNRNINLSGKSGINMFSDCPWLPWYSEDHIDSSMAKNRLDGGYFFVDYQGMMKISDSGQATFYTIRDRGFWSSNSYMVETDRATPPDWPSEKITSYDSTHWFKNNWMQNVSSIAFWFKNSKITSFDFSNLTLANNKIVNAKQSLSNCPNLIKVDIVGTDPFVYKADATGFVSECVNLETFNGFFRCHKAKCLDQMFWGCSKLKNVNAEGLHGYMNFEDLESAILMFAGCSSLETLYIGDMFAPAAYSRCKLTNCSAMFSGCTALKNLYCYNGEDNWYKFLEGKTTSLMFDGCTSLPHYSDSSPKDAQWAKADNGTEGYFTIKP